jgi:transcriptional regulator with XRE-family HTH domain
MPSEHARPGKRPKKPSLIDPMKLRRRRFAAGLSSTALAERSGLALSTVSDYENGRRSPSPDSLARLAEALNCETTDLMHAMRERKAVA